MSRTLLRALFDAFAPSGLARRHTNGLAQVSGCWPARPHASGTPSASIVTANGTLTYMLPGPASNGPDVRLAVSPGSDVQQV